MPVPTLLASNNPVDHLLVNTSFFEMDLPEWLLAIGITTPVVYMLLAAVLVAVIAIRVARNWQGVPRPGTDWRGMGLGIVIGGAAGALLGRLGGTSAAIQLGLFFALLFGGIGGLPWQALIEPVLLFVRDDIVRGNIRDPHDHGGAKVEDAHQAGNGHRWADRLTPFFWSLFFFILVTNLLGLTPNAVTATGRLSVTGALAVVEFGMVIAFGMALHGPGRYWIQLVPPDVPFTIAKVIPNPIWFVVLVIEIVGIIAKPFALTVRLFANMTGGHIVIGVLLMFATWMNVFNGSEGVPTGLLLGGFVSLSSALAAVAFFALEIIVAFIQAYVFALLTAIFVGLSIAPEH